jgi:crotonobetainyl-CoA:carnitine CoA-transferase CaiB-like acyl-CoA transferase
MWTRLCNAIGRPDLIEDARFRGNGDRAKNQTALYEILEPIFRTRTASEWVALAEELDIPTSLVADMSEVVEQEQALARQAVVAIEGHEGVRSAGIPIKLSRTPATIRKPPPSMGADGDEILRGLGIDEKEIKALRACGAIGSVSTT